MTTSDKDKLNLPKSVALSTLTGGVNSFKFDSNMIAKFENKRKALTQNINYHFKIYMERIISTFSPPTDPINREENLKRKGVWTPENNKKVTVLNYSCTQIQSDPFYLWFWFELNNCFRFRKNRMLRAAWPPRLRVPQMQVMRYSIGCPLITWWPIWFHSINTVHDLFLVLVICLVFFPSRLLYFSFFNRYVLTNYYWLLPCFSMMYNIFYIIFSDYYFSFLWFVVSFLISVILYQQHFPRSRQVREVDAISTPGEYNVGKNSRAINVRSAATNFYPVYLFIFALSSHSSHLGLSILIMRIVLFINVFSYKKVYFIVNLSIYNILMKVLPRISLQSTPSMEDAEVHTPGVETVVWVLFILLWINNDNADCFVLYSLNVTL